MPADYSHHDKLAGGLSGEAPVRRRELEGKRIPDAWKRSADEVIAGELESAGAALLEAVADVKRSPERLELGLSLELADVAGHSSSWRAGFNAFKLASRVRRDMAAQGCSELECAGALAHLMAEGGALAPEGEGYELAAWSAGFDYGFQRSRFPEASRGELEDAIRRAGLELGPD